VKRAYRRLVKAHHPDTAGESAIPRFLAIQAAYEALVGDDGRGRRRPGVARQAPWQADADRAQATREAWRARSTRAGRRPGGEADAEDGASAGRGAAEPDDASGSRRRRTERPRRGGSERPPDRATPGSTSYDHAEPFDPEWSGASWYGQSSGTYWTINPKEYADPRKHGPEYQARGRRRDEGPAAWQSTDLRSSDGDGHAAPATEVAAGAFQARATVHDAGAAPDDRIAFDIGARTLEPRISGPGGRLAAALIGWPPIGLGVALAVGELSGCSRFAATCVEPLWAGIWLAQAAIIAVLLALPLLAGIAVVGSLAVLAAAIPSAVVLSAVGGSRSPAAAGGVLLALLALAWLVGVGLAIARRSRTMRT
jgi:hypothetical protein